jgi:hypothetical protein
VPVGDGVSLDADAATIVVAWRTGKKAQARTVRAGGDVVDVLRGYAKQALQVASSGQGRPYNPDDDQEAEESYLTAGQEELFDTALIDEVRRGSSLPLIAPDALRNQALALYALLIGNSPDSRMVFVRKTNPVKFARRGLVAVFDNALTRVTQPVLVFDGQFDLVLHGGRVWIFNQQRFEALFRESDAVLAQTAKWVDDLGQALPIADDGRQWLTGRLRQNSVFRRKVVTILRSSYLPKLTPETLAGKMTEHGLDPGALIVDGCLVFNKDTEKDMLLLLNEDLWTGDFSGDRYAAARKAKV